MAKIKEVKVTANYAWSPAEAHPVYIAAGTAAQQLDATFSSTAKLELYAIDMTDSSVAAKCEGRMETSNRFQKVVWGGTHAESSHANGLIVCGTDKGGIEIYSPDKILKGDDDCLVDHTLKHTGPVGALDFNPFQKNLFASGASEREIFIWDMKNPGNPMTPGAKTQPIAPISAISWNRQVQHILASTSAITSGPCCVVWDLRKNEPIIKVQDPSGRMQCSDVAWHPEVATQLVLASEDDHSPVVQLWDLRFATSPMKVLEKHQKGVMSVSWCPRDPDLLLSCGKDNHVFCWNPNTSPPEIVYEFETNAQWCFDVQWCARNPNVISTGSFDGRIVVHSLMGGGSAIEDDVHEEKQRNAVAEAFGTNSLPAERPQSNATAQKRKAGVPLKKPPKWMRTPCGASFAFGGKLVTFQHEATTEPQQHQAAKRTVTVNQVVTEKELLEQSKELRNALTDNMQCSTFCQKRFTEAKNEFDENIWSFLKVNFDPDPRQQYLQLLGYSAAELKSKFNSVIKEKSSVNGDLTSQINDVSLNDSSNNSVTANDSVPSDSMDVFEQIAAKGKTPPKAEVKPMQIPVTEGDLDSMISQALLIGDYDAAVDLCLHGDRMADAIVIAIAGGEQLLEKTQKKYFAASESKISRLLSAVVTKDWQDVVKSCELENWKEALASLLTYASPDELITLCDELGGRLEGSAENRAHACLCYICSGNIDRLVRCWDSAKPKSDESDDGCKAIQDLVEKIMVLFRVVEQQSQGRSAAGFGEASAEKLAEYASLLAAQGELAPAMEILPRTSNKEVIQILQDRLFHAQGDMVAGVQPPPFPFARDGIRFGQRPEVQVLPQRRDMYGRQTQQNAYSQAATSMIQTASQPQSYTPRSQALRSQNQPSPNPYSSTRPLQQRNAYTGSPQVPASLYNPQSVSASPSFPAMQSSAPAAMMQVQPQPTMTSPYQPYQPPAVSNGPRSQVGQMQPQAPTQNPPSSMPGPPPSGGDALRKSSAGWNDPPALDPNRIPRKKKQPMQPVIKPEELNLMTPAPQPRAPQHPGFMQQPQPSGAPMAHGPTMGYPQQMPMNPQTQAANMVQQMQQAPVPTASVPTAAPKAVPKAPIPAEHQVLQTQFDELIKRCNSQATNAQMKRKLEDCSRRLEFLYDKLRASTLSQNVVAGLHQVAQSISARDYTSGLRQHQHIVSHSNFSEISAFMPGVKTMLQIAGQLRI